MGFSSLRVKLVALVRRVLEELLGQRVNSEWEVETLAQDSFRSSVVKEGERTVAGGWAKWRKGFFFLFCHYYYFLQKFILKNTIGSKTTLHSSYR